MEKRKNKTRLARAAMTLLVMLFCFTGARAQLFSENFEGGSMPDGWTTDGPGTWSVGTGDHSSTTGAGEGTYNAKITHSNTGNVTKLITPEIDLSTVRFAEFSFMYVMRSWSGDTDELRVYYRASSSEEWTKLTEYTDATNGWTTVGEIALPNLSSTYQIAFEMTDKFGYGVGIDDVKIVQGASCSRPFSLSASLTPGNGTVATLSWTETGEATQWQICLNEDEDNLIVAGTNPFTLTGLKAETTYTAKVRAYCDADNQSDWSTPVTFTPTDAYSFTVNDGTSTNGYVPIYGFYTDNITKSQFIIPAATLEDMAYGIIKKLTFYSSNASISWGDAQFEVYMAETEATTLSALVDYTTMQQVKSAGSLSISGNKMEVTLDNPYQYQGGNLMIGFLQTVQGTYQSCNWYGVQASGASMGGYDSSVNQRNFLPKTTFEYSPGLAPTCPKPTNLVAGSIDTHSAVLSWTEKGEADQWQICINGDESNLIAVNENPFTLTNLVPETAYSVKVRAYCSAEDQSSWSDVVTFTTAPTCPKPTNLTAGTPDAHSVELSWTENGEATQWQICINDDETNLIDVNENPFTLTNLDPETAYRVKVRAYCSAEDQSSWSNVVTFTTAPTCPKPTNLTAGTPDAHSVELSWTENGEATQWQICINDDETNLIDVNENPYTLTNLDPETAYSVKVRAYCSAEDQSSWSDAVTFTTAPTCLKPTNLVAGSIDTHSAVLSWTEKGEADQWQICINGDESSLIAVNANPFTLTNLVPETDYSVKVRAYCSAEDQSSWSDVVTFTTGIANPAPTDVLADNVTSTSADISWTGNDDATSYNLRYRTARGFNYGFETAEPWAVDDFDPCTTYDGDQTQCYVFNGETFTNIPFTGSTIAFQSQGGNLSSHSGNAFGLMINPASSSQAADDWFILPELTINEGDIFSFWGREITSNYGPETINVGIYGETDGTFSATLAENVEVYTTDWTEYSYDLSAYVGQTIRLAVNCVSLDVFGFMIDDIFVGNPNDDTWDVTLTNVTSPNELTGLTPSTDYEAQVQAVYADGSSQWVGTSFTTDVEFAAPENLEMTDISTTTATVSWTAPSATVTGYVYQYKKASAEEWSTEATITETSVELSGLDSGTPYNFRVKAVYDGGSSTFAKIDFTTDCLPKDLPYSYGFEDTNELNCWSLLSANSNNLLGISSFDAAYEGNNVFVFSSYNNASSYDQYLISPTLNTTSPVAVEFYYRIYGNSESVETFVVGYSTTTADPAEFTWGEEISTNTMEWTPYTHVFPAGTKYVAIYYYSNYQFYLLVDDFSITEAESTNILFAKAGYATYYNGEKDVMLPAGMKAHVVTDGSTNLTYAEVADGDTDGGNVVPAGTAVLLQVEPSTEDQTLPVYLVTPSAAAYAGTNLLFGSDEATETTGGAKYYKLTYSNSDDNFGWYWGAANGAAFTSPAHKAWLALPASSAPFFGLPGWEDTTGIVPVGVDSENGEWYTLQGLKIGKKPTTKGVYIHNGRKVVIK